MVFFLTIMKIKFKKKKKRFLANNSYAEQSIYLPFSYTNQQDLSRNYGIKTFYNIYFFFSLLK